MYQDPTTPENCPNLLQTALNAAAQPKLEHISLDQLIAGQIPALLVPKTHDIKLLDTLEAKLPGPLRKSGQVSVDDADSFIQYLSAHGDPEGTTVWMTADFSRGSVLFTGILNDHSRHDAAWRDHTIRFEPVYSEEWKRWTGKDKTAMSQTEFASFIEDNLGEIAPAEGMPTGSQILEMALTFEAAAEKRFKSATRLQSGGVSLEYVDQEDAATLARMQMFERFALGMAPFFGGQAYRIDARLKYRIREGKLALWYELIRPDRVLQDATEALAAKIRNEAGFAFYVGKPLLKP